MPTIRYLWFALLAWPTAAAADEGLCRNGLFGGDNPVVGLARIVGEGRTHFFHDMEGCPGAGARCRLKSYVVRGDRVVTGRSRGKHVCVYFPSKGGGTAGWIDAARMRRVPVRQDPPLSSWLGHWSDEGNPLLQFSMRGRRLAAKGIAAWPSFDPSSEQMPGGPHTGEIDEAVRTNGNRAFAPECEITFTLLGDLIVAADPKMQCGGVNVSFSGVYRRSKP